MEGPSSFVDVRHVSAEYTQASSLIARLTGQPRLTHSVLRDVTFKLGQGDQVVLYGAPAAGKTTLLRLLAGGLTPSAGKIWINGHAPAEVRLLAAGYVSSEESEPRSETVYDILHAFGKAHNIPHLPSRLGETAELLGFSGTLTRPAATLSVTERLRINLARAYLADAPLLLLDDVADELGAAELQRLITAAFPRHTVILATRNTLTAEQFDWPLMLLHGAELARFGTRDDLANSLACSRLLHAWIEGLRYDVLRQLKQHPGVVDVRLIPSSQFSGQQLRIVLRTHKYLASIYDLLSHTPLIRVEEVPPSLEEIISRL